MKALIFEGRFLQDSFLYLIFFTNFKLNYLYIREKYHLCTLAAVYSHSNENFCPEFRIAGANYNFFFFFFEVFML